jgi:hypothetical protein
MIGVSAIALIAWMMLDWSTTGKLDRSPTTKASPELQAMLQSAASASPPATDSVTEAARRVTARLARQAYAKRIEDAFLDKGMDVRVTCRGSDRTVLRLEYVLAGRVFVHQVDKSDLVTTAQRLGFTRVEILNSDGVEGYWNLRDYH